MTRRDGSDAQIAASRCRYGRHIFPPTTATGEAVNPDLAQTCECGHMLIDKTLGGGRVVETVGPKIKEARRRIFDAR